MRPASRVPGDTPFGAGARDPVVVHTGLVVGQPFADRFVHVWVEALGQRGLLDVTVHSSPVSLFDGPVGAHGTSAVTTRMPTALPKGVHALEARVNDGRTSYVAALPFSVNAAGIVTAIGPSSMLQGFSGAGDSRLVLSLHTGRPVYDVALHAMSAAGVVIAGAALLSIAGVSSALGSASGGLMPTGSGGGRDLAEAALEGLELRELERVGEDREAWGDRSGTWRLPGTRWVDRVFAALAQRFASTSTLVPRVVVDGAWARAIFGTASLALLGIGVVLGVADAVSASWSPLVPGFAVLVALLILASLDALGAIIAWAVLVLSAVVEGRAMGVTGLRTAIGLAVLILATSTLAQVVRPLRRYFLSSREERVERLIDYLLLPFVVAFGVGAALKGLNGLSGLEIVSPHQIDAARWIVAAMITLRLGAEDVATHFYPRRMKAVHPDHLDRPSRRAIVGALVVRTAVFFLVATPYVGFGLVAIVGALLLALPAVGRLVEDRLPDLGLTDRWLPRGFSLFAVTLLLGQLVTAGIIGSHATSGALQRAFLWLIIPGVLFKCLDLTAKRPAPLLARPARIAIGAPLAALTLSVAVGLVVPFG